ncbi:unnamed protein product [Vitrella brassicaformis CCMP3155]|uniref:Uncharacterized protein n=2 Tax=Vitrella brassicaformis TaxID=1169539 RepID=A0A0G4EU15_VITBC|nr:unnamed protein product [Vitrella brassicaformis CCMP3155]|eukprot:CEM01885.1 unnamed protein product [Vitrella brassicaformis CCMP3155]
MHYGLHDRRLAITMSPVVSWKPSPLELARQRSWLLTAMTQQLRIRFEPDGEDALSMSRQQADGFASLSCLFGEDDPKNVEPEAENQPLHFDASAIGVTKRIARLVLRPAAHIAAAINKSTLVECLHALDAFDCSCVGEVLKEVEDKALWGHWFADETLCAAMLDKLVDGPAIYQTFLMLPGMKTMVAKRIIDRPDVVAHYMRRVELYRNKAYEQAAECVWIKNVMATTLTMAEKGEIELTKEKLENFLVKSTDTATVTEAMEKLFCSRDMHLCTTELIEDPFKSGTSTHIGQMEVQCGGQTKITPGNHFFSLAHGVEVNQGESMKLADIERFELLLTPTTDYGLQTACFNGRAVYTLGGTELVAGILPAGSLCVSVGSHTEGVFQATRFQKKEQYVGSEATLAEVEVEVTVYFYPMRTFALHYLRMLIESRSFDVLGEVVHWTSKRNSAPVSECLCMFIAYATKELICPMELLTTWFSHWEDTLSSWTSTKAGRLISGSDPADIQPHALRIPTLVQLLSPTIDGNIKSDLKATLLSQPVIDTLFDAWLASKPGEDAMDTSSHARSTNDSNKRALDTSQAPSPISDSHTPNTPPHGGDKDAKRPRFQ